MTGWWLCRTCETANRATTTCAVCDGGDGVGLRGDLVRRVRAVGDDPPPLLPAPPAGRPPMARMTWQQRLEAEARWLYEQCAGVLRRIARALS
jgi:hypothetical protein